MPFDINAFRSQLIGDGARPNLFEVRVNQSSISGGVPDQTRFLVKSAQLPGSTVGTVPLFYFGRELKFAGNRTFPDWTVTVINDEDFKVRNFFEKWMNGINSHAGNLRNSNGLPPASYTANLDVLQYGKKDASKEIKKYKFIGAFPVDVSPIDLDWGSNDTIEEFTVTFAYQWWESDTTDTVGSTPTNTLGQSFPQGTTT